MAHSLASDRPGSSSTLIDWLTALTIASFFSGFNQYFGPAKIQLSDVLAAVSVFVVSLRGFPTPRFSAPVLVSFLAFMAYYCLSALLVDPLLGIKELIQAVLLFAWAFVTFGHYTVSTSSRLLRIAVVMLLVVLTYNILWHMTQGYYVGWKRLNEPKTVFSLLPVMLVLVASQLKGRYRTTLVIAAVFAAALILLSGERKAYIVAMAALAIWTAPFNWRHLLATIVLAPLLWLVLSLDQTGYLDRQVGSLSSRLQDGGVEDATFTHLLDETRPGTVSDAQREFTKRFANELWQREPLFGIGTNGYSRAISQYSSIPLVFRGSIHGEFYRVLYENGVIGLVLYGFVWVIAGAHILIAWRDGAQAARPKLSRIRVIVFVMLLIYCSLEAGKGLTMLCICLLPFLPVLSSEPVRSAATLRGVIGSRGRLRSVGG